MMNPFEQMMVPGGADPMMRLGKDWNLNKDASPKDLEPHRQKEPFSSVLEKTREARERPQETTKTLQETTKTPPMDEKRPDERIEEGPVKVDEETLHQARVLFREDIAQLQKVSLTPQGVQADFEISKGVVSEGETVFPKAAARSLDLPENLLKNQLSVKPPQVTPAGATQKAPSSEEGVPFLLKANVVTQRDFVKRDLSEDALISTDASASPDHKLETSPIQSIEVLGDEFEAPALTSPHPIANETVLEEAALVDGTKKTAPVLTYKTAEIEAPPRMKPMSTSPEILKINESFLFAGAPDHQKGTMGGDEGGFPGNASMLFSPVLPGQEGQTRAQPVKSQFQPLLDAGVDMPDEREILRQVNHQLRAWRPGQGEPLRFLLEPKQLGMLQIEILLQEKGVTAHMVTADPLVKALLQENQGFLQAGLKSQGLHISQFSVELGDRQGFFNQNSGQHFSRRTLPDTDATDQRHTALPVMQKPTREGGRLSLYI